MFTARLAFLVHPLRSSLDATSHVVESLIRASKSTYLFRAVNSPTRSKLCPPTSSVLSHGPASTDLSHMAECLMWSKLQHVGGTKRFSPCSPRASFRAWPDKSSDSVGLAASHAGLLVLPVLTGTLAEVSPIYSLSRLSSQASPRASIDYRCSHSVVEDYSCLL